MIIGERQYSGSPSRNAGPGTSSLRNPATGSDLVPLNARSKVNSTGRPNLNNVGAANGNGPIPLSVIKEEDKSETLLVSEDFYKASFDGASAL